MNLNNIRIVLVSTSHPGNIGAAARAMKNMGLQRLYLVEPRDFPSGVATGRAASAVDILEQATVCQSLQEAISDCALVVGTSARSRSIPWPVLDPQSCGRQVLEDSAAHQVALVFGREDSGLSNEELQLCHYHVQIPANPDYPSLNLAAAVMLLGYEIFRQSEAAPVIRPAEEDWDREFAAVAEVENYLARLERLLVRLDFHDPQNPRQLMPRLRRLYSRTRLDKMEVNILHGILTAAEEGLQAPASLPDKAESSPDKSKPGGRVTGSGE